jgi:hypothetical protein
VHVRRGDVSQNDPDYFTSNTTILRTMGELRSIFGQNNITECVFTLKALELILMICAWPGSNDF